MFLNFCVLNMFQLMVFIKFQHVSTGFTLFLFFKKNLLPSCYQQDNMLFCIPCPKFYSCKLYYQAKNKDWDIFVFGIHQSLIIFFKYNGSSNKSITKQNKKLKVSSHISIIFTLISIVHGQLWHNLYYLLFCQNFQKQIIFYVKIFEIQSKHKQGNHI